LVRLYMAYLYTQVYLLPYCTAHQVQLPGNEHRSIANCYADPRNVSYYHTFERQCSNSTCQYIIQPSLQQIQLMELRPKPYVATSAVGAISSSSSLTTLLISVNGVPWRIFFQVHSCAYKKGSREQNHAHFMGYMSSLSTKFDSFSFSHS